MEFDLRLGDCVERTREIESSSIDLILTSPPYDKLRAYTSGSVFDFKALAGQLKRVLKPGGVLVWVVGDETKDWSETGTSFRQALHFMSLGLNLHDTMIYAKKNPMPGGDRKSRYLPSFEFMFVLANGRPKTTNIATEPCKMAGVKWSRRTFRDHGKHLRISPWAEDKTLRETKPRQNIWSYAVGREKKGHPAAFSLQLAIDHILSWTNPGDTVLDPFVGSGTTLEACINTDRNGIGIEKSPEYLAIAERRIAAARAKHPLFPCLT